MTEMKMLLTRPATGGDSYGYNSFLIDRRLLRGNLDYKKDNNRNGF